ncbi:MAG: dihydroorotate dehydrogenase [Candidatus Pristimantibacillus lignocellulolyticus]|uniref:Dihydroorotate dehydrogenase n=1 Tax=Candidatus Pristimantibacillus lignocellulolyticus TaxID=2994561 RepID=A0A9J6ZJ39_9BACL|nr:MAG: dihydroorotate dehydrogenase [Candidatus Pristimantibacillus lignocellulolyticus]
MPDWSYHPLKKLFLNNLIPSSSREFIHKSMSTIASIPGGRALINFLGHMNPPSQFKKEISNTTFPSPIGLSSLIDPNLSGIKAFQELGFGFIEVGPIVLNEPKKQFPPILHNKQLQFAHHQEKLPLKLALKQFTNLNSRVPIFAKIDEQVDRQELTIIAQQLTPYVDAFVATCEQISFFYETNTIPTLYASFSANEINSEAFKQFLEQTSVAGIVINAPRQTIDNYWHEEEKANECLTRLVRQVKNLHPELVVITSGGVDNPDDAYALVHAGADLMMLTEGYVMTGPGLPKRTHERLLYEEVQPTKTVPWHWSLLFGISIFIGGLIALYFAFTSIILPYDESFIGLRRADILQINPLILSFMSHDRMALAGTMISGGILYIQLARHGLKYGMHWAKIAFHSAAIIGFLGIFLFIGYGYFDWLHGLFWLILLPIYYFSYKEGKAVIGTPYSNHGSNDRAWQLGNYGQLMFVLLGFSIVVGGIVISIIGVSKVFIATDLSFLCMSPEMIESINNKLIPVIAHDRAGFGGALVSVGLLVLMLSLWGFRQGERWIWNTLAIGALPAFITGIGTHIYIGYTTFIHLLPVYFLVILYLVGLVLSYRYLKLPSTKQS